MIEMPRNPNMGKSPFDPDYDEDYDEEAAWEAYERECDEAVDRDIEARHGL